MQTHRHKRSALPWHDDYLFATKAMADRLVHCEAVDRGDPDPWKFSDHCPVVAEFDIELEVPVITERSSRGPDERRRSDT